MTAIALALILIGIVLIRCFGTNVFESYIGNHNAWDYIGLACFVVGSVMLFGVVIHLLWKLAP